MVIGEYCPLTQHNVVNFFEQWIVWHVEAGQASAMVVVTFAVQKRLTLDYTYDIIKVAVVCQGISS